MGHCCPKKFCRQPHSNGPTKVIGHGSFPVRYGRRRRYRYLGCGGTFSQRIDTAYYRFRCSRRTFDRVAHMAVEGMSPAAIARVEGVGWNTANRWITRAAAFAPGKSRPAWVFTSMEVCSRVWVSTVVGRRSYRNTHALINDTLARSTIVELPLIATDGFKFYARVIRRLFGAACIYGQVVKTWRKDRVIKVERRPVIGTRQRLDDALERSEDSVSLNTSYIERLNLTLRRSVSYLARRTPGHARCTRRLTDHLELARCHYNFLRPHAGLQFGQELRAPAMVAGISHRRLSFRDIFTLTPTNS